MSYYLLISKLKSELEKLKLEKANIQSINHDYKQPSTSSKVYLMFFYMHFYVFL